MFLREMQCWSLGMIFKRECACDGMFEARSLTYFWSRIGGGGARRAGGVNEGENSVFPIQVSLQELLLFLERCYFYEAYQNTGAEFAQVLFGADWQREAGSPMAVHVPARKPACQQ